MQDYLFFNILYLFVFMFELMEFFIISESYIRQKCLIKLYCKIQILHEKNYGVDCQLSGQISDSNNTLPDIYNFLLDIVRCLAIILSLVMILLG